MWFFVVYYKVALEFLKLDWIRDRCEKVGTEFLDYFRFFVLFLGCGGGWCFLFEFRKFSENVSHMWWKFGIFCTLFFDTSHYLFLKCRIFFEENCCADFDVPTFHFIFPPLDPQTFYSLFGGTRCDHCQPPFAGAFVLFPPSNMCCEWIINGECIFYLPWLVQVLFFNLCVGEWIAKIRISNVEIFLSFSSFEVLNLKLVKLVLDVFLHTQDVGDNWFFIVRFESKYNEPASYVMSCQTRPDKANVHAWHWHWYKCELRLRLSLFKLQLAHVNTGILQL